MLARLITLAVTSMALAPLQATATATPAAILENYANLAQAGYEDSLVTARTLLKKIDGLLASSTEANLQAARKAWIDARVPYQQTEVFRFGNELVDEWEGKVNAWPLDEGLIDYVAIDRYGEASDENPLYTANIIANPRLTLNGEPLDADIIDQALLRRLHEAEAVEANVATGYHAIEFLLWGQDLNGTDPGAGNRPASDFDTTNCTSGHCDRRGQYLKVATELLINDLQEMADSWAPDGAARQALMAKGEAGGLAAMLTGMGSLSYGELAGERTRLGLLLHDPEEEHDCFSDNTHWSHYYNVKGILNVYRGEYMRIDGRQVKGASLSALIRQSNPILDQDILTKLDTSLQAAQAMVDAAAIGQTFDVLIAAGNDSGNQLVRDFVGRLIEQTRALEKAVDTVGSARIVIEGSESLNNPASVQ